MVNGWVKCGVDRMPPPGEEVLVRLPDGDIYVGARAKDLGGWMCWWAVTPVGDEQLHAVTHWMPLPPQPEDADAA